MTMMLSKGALSIIMNGGEFLNPVVQVLGHKLLPQLLERPGEERYRMLISDGELINGYVLLASWMRHRLRNGELSNYTVIKITDLVVSEVKNDRGTKRILIIMNFEVIIPGSEVGMQFGNPVERPPNRSAKDHTTLSTGAISVIMGGGEFIDPVVQVLGHKALPCQGDGQERYRMVISDGELINGYALLAPQMSHRLRNGELTDYTVIKITNRVVYNLKNDRGTKKVLIITDIEVIKPGSEVGMRIGNPVDAAEVPLDSLMAQLELF